MPREAKQIVDEARQMFESELDSFVPDVVFDAHFEVWDKDARMKDSVAVDIPTRFEDVQPGLEALHPGRQFKAAFIPFSYDAEKVPPTNEWASQQAARSGGTCCS